MWAMEYNPNLYASYWEPRDPSAAVNQNVPIKINNKLLKQYGKFERAKVKGGSTDQKIALAVFLVASVLETKNKRFLKEAKGLDDVVRVLSLSIYMCVYIFVNQFYSKKETFLLSYLRTFLSGGYIGHVLFTNKIL